MLTDRLSQLKQVNPQKQRLLVDLPSNMLLQGINNILAGKNSTNPQANSFIRKLGSQGMTPEQIRLAFIEEQRRSANPLMILG